uniref:ABC transmembrane type-1 domain-containing protein n=1 Tax=Syphacia muris TaxID=451379 RepID=A0A0N5ACI7_9BILA
MAICGIICGIVFGLQLPANTLTFGLVFNAFSASIYDDGLIRKLLGVCGLYLLTGFVCMIAEFGGTVFFGILSESMTVKFRVKSLRSILQQDGKYFDVPDNAPGKLITHLAADAPKIRAASFCECWEVSLCGAGFILLFGLMQTILVNRIKQEDKKYTKNDNSERKISGVTEASHFQLSVEIIENVRTIQLLTRENAFNVRYGTALNSFIRAENKKALMEALNFAMSQSFNCFVITCSYSIALHCVSIGRVVANDSFK